MGIEVENYMWVGVYVAEFVRQFGEQYRLTTAPPIDDESLDRFAGEAATLADLSLEAYRRLNVRERLKRE